MLKFTSRSWHHYRRCWCLHVSLRRHHSVVANQLGLRSRRPPDSTGPDPDPDNTPEQPQPDHEKEENISDEEWELRTGRAIYTLQQTLPDFFNSGLASWHADSHDAKSRSLLSKLPLTGLTKGDEEESIYSPNVRLIYTPPARLPPPFPQTFRLEGLPLYLASSVFIRHTMKTFYSDLHVALTKCAVNTPPPSVTSPSSEKRKINREKSVTIAVSVLGSSRVSGAKAEWDVTSTYKFSPISGLILTHTVNEIHPAPHLTAYEGLRSLVGLQGPVSAAEGGLAGHEQAQAVKDGAI